ncbi:MAG TPA: sigma-E factor negative regulatory protein [Rudaea sp.]|jgi:sigma-E factor negative regulatory protein RseA|uniref:sigma-E factor negative regulatory protein n=1 Tax=Rudaea sp. TaxID=2136325 RepID=UPI002F94D6AE
MSEEIQVNANQQFCEQLSAMVDGELARDQVRFLLRGVDTQSDLARRWSSYHVISATLRHEYVALALPGNFADGIIGRLQTERGALAGTTARRLGALRWVGGGAIAAAVAVVALVVSRPVGDSVVSARTTLGPVVAQQAPAQQVRSPYLPVLAPPAAIANPLPMAGFNANDVLPASFRFDSVLPDYYSPRGNALLRSDLSATGVPYVLYLRLPQRPPATQAAPQSVASPQ